MANSDKLNSLLMGIATSRRCDGGDDAEIRIEEFHSLITRTYKDTKGDLNKSLICRLCGVFLIFVLLYVLCTVVLSYYPSFNKWSSVFTTFGGWLAGWVTLLKPSVKTDVPSLFVMRKALGKQYRDDFEAVQKEFPRLGRKYKIMASCFGLVILISFSVFILLVF
jgi:hypothetical protein